jgi:hypothetical protein
MDTIFAVKTRPRWNIATKLTSCSNPTFDESSVVPSTPRPRPSIRRTGRKDINVDPSESASKSGLRILCRATDASFPRTQTQRSYALRKPKRHQPPSTPDIPTPKKGSQSWGVGGGDLLRLRTRAGRLTTAKSALIKILYLRGAPKLGRRRRSCAARSGVATPSGCEAYPISSRRSRG